MVFYGGFSKGCITCLKRRIKCDEQKPACQRCIKSKRDCQGYRDEQILAFRDEGQAAAGNAPRWRNNIRNQTRFNEHTHGLRRFTDAILDASMHSEAALCGLPTIAIVKAGLAEPGSSLHRAREALNTAMMAARDSQNQGLRESSLIKYGKAISSVATDAKAGYNAQDTLICILLLVLTGVTMQSEPNLRWWAVHNKAAEAIVRKCGTAFGKDLHSLQLLLCIRSQMIFRYSTRADVWHDIIDDCDPSLLSWSDIPAVLADHPAFELQKLLTPMPHLRWDFREFMDQSCPPLDWYWGMQIIEQCLVLDGELCLWHQSLPVDWQILQIEYEPVSLPEDPDLKYIMTWARGEKVHLCRDQWKLFHLSSLRIYRLFIQSFILNIGTRLLGFSVQETVSGAVRAEEPLHSILMQSKEALLSTLDDVCRSVYQCMGLLQATATIKTPDDLQPPMFAPIILLRILWSCNSVIIADDRHRLMVKASLRVLGNRLGMAMARHLGNSPSMCLTPLFSEDPRNYLPPAKQST